MLEAKKLKPDL